VTAGWRRLWRSPWRAALAGAAGAVMGGAYAHFIGCRTGTCLITSSVWTASLYGAAIGALAGWPAKAPAPQAGADADERG
jgi:hypothetical protein